MLVIGRIDGDNVLGVGGRDGKSKASGEMLVIGEKGLFVISTSGSRRLDGGGFARGTDAFFGPLFELVVMRDEDGRLIFPLPSCFPG